MQFLPIKDPALTVVSFNIFSGHGFQTQNICWIIGRILRYLETNIKTLIQTQKRKYGYQFDKDNASHQQPVIRNLPDGRQVIRLTPHELPAVVCRAEGLLMFVRLATFRVTRNESALKW